MTVSKETCRELMDGLLATFAGRKRSSIIEHSLKAFGLCIANEANQICGDNVGGSSARVAANAPVRRTGGRKNGEKNGAKSGDGDGDGDGDADSDVSKAAPHAERRRVRLVRTGIPSEGYVRLSQILDAIPIGRSSWYAGVKSGKYPTPVKLGPRTTAWLVADIRDLIDMLASGVGPVGASDSDRSQFFQVAA